MRAPWRSDLFGEGCRCWWSSRTCETFLSRGLELLPFKEVRIYFSIDPLTYCIRISVVNAGMMKATVLMTVRWLATAVTTRGSVTGRGGTLGDTTRIVRVVHQEDWRETITKNVRFVHLDLLHLTLSSKPSFIESLPY